MLHRSCSFCSLYFHYCVVWIDHQTGQEQTTGNGQETSPQIHLTLDTTCSNFSPLAGATEFCVPKQLNTKTVSFHRLSL